MSFLQSPFNPISFSPAEATQRNISSIDPKLSRTNYYDGRLLKASDLIRDQLYLDERLREVGRVLGQGIVRGLDLILTTEKKLLLSPGLAIAPSGRVLELEKTNLEINLLDSAKIAELNEGFRYLERGLYAVVLQYAEEGHGSAEIYPRDLQAQRGFHFNAFAEGVELILIRLNTQLPHQKQHQFDRMQNAVIARSALVRSLLAANPGQLPEIPEQGVALGLVAVENGEPQWLDKGLLRRPHRNAQTLNYLQTDLFNHYEELLIDVMQLRNNSVRPNQFSASHYFELMPPFGSIPKDNVDPVNGYQNYFPEGFEVSISPVRLDDLQALVQQSIALEPIDLRRDKDVDIMIVIPLDDQTFAYRARQLQHRRLVGSAEEFVLPPHFDDYALRSYGKNAHAENTDSAVWQQIWPEAKQVFYLRRPTRVAETQVSAVVLATGDYEALAAIEQLPPSLEDIEEQMFTLENIIEEQKEKIAQLEAELSEAPVDELAAALATITNLESQLASALAEISRLQGIIDSTPVDTGASDEEIKKLTEQLAQTQAKLIQTEANFTKTLEYLFELQQFLRTVLSDRKIQLSEPELLLKLRRVENDDATAAAEKTLSVVKENPELQASLIALLALMPATFDVLNWPSLLFVFSEKMQDKLLELLQKITPQHYPVLMHKSAEELGFPAELIASWKKVANSLQRNAPKPATRAELEAISPVKLNRLIPDSFPIAADTRTQIQERVDADPDLIKILSQLNAIVDEPYKEALWNSLPTLIDSKKMEEFIDFVLASNQKGLPLGVSVGSSNTSFKLPVALRTSWSDIDLKR